MNRRGQRSAVDDLNGQLSRPPGWRQRQCESKKGLRGARNANSGSTDRSGRGEEYGAMKRQQAGQERLNATAKRSRSRRLHVAEYGRGETRDETECGDGLMRGWTNALVTVN
jgi:hypothetical protein